MEVHEPEECVSLVVDLGTIHTKVVQLGGPRLSRLRQV